MRIMNARNFRAEFWKLHEPVAVVSKERVVGVWTPTDQAQVMGVPVGRRVALDVAEIIGIEKAAGTAPLTQADRDAILRKINRAK